MHHIDGRPLLLRPSPTAPADASSPTLTAGDISRRRVLFARPGTGFLSPDARDVPGPKRVSPTASNVPADRKSGPGLALGPLLRADAAPGVEGRVHAHVHARLRVALVVQDPLEPVEAVGLEAENPLVVAQAEG